MRPVHSPQESRVRQPAAHLPGAACGEASAARSARVSWMPAALEIIGPVERKMIINALNSGADSYMKDFQDWNAPSGRRTHRQFSGDEKCGSRRPSDIALTD
jgi:hypothetical protein